MDLQPDTGRELSQPSCRARLLWSRDGYLACTRFALPLVVPVDLACSDGELLVTVHDRHRCGPLAGDVVALTVGGRPGAASRGWAVSAIGQLVGTAGESLRLDVSSLQGWTYGGPTPST